MEKTKMVRHTANDAPSGVTIAETAEILEIIREEQNSASGSIDMLKEEQCGNNNICKCDVQKSEENVRIIGLSPDEVDIMIQQHETQLRDEYEKKLEKEMNALKERFDFILSNEQLRATYMLREAHRERQEKITALQAQIECKNLAGLMYVMCAERRRSKLEKLRLVKNYTTYIRALQEILSEAQDLILHLSRGYKTAARVDQEWRSKMMKIVSEFMSFVYHYAGGTKESNQYFFDLPALLKTKESLKDDPKEDPCSTSEEDRTMSVESFREKTWWETLEGNDRPFVMFGDMAEFTPDQRRQTLKAVKGAKTAPRKWKDYVFNEMFVKAECSNSDVIKDIYPTRLPTSEKWVCHEGDQDLERTSRMSFETNNRRATGHSVDIRGNMGSILKIITSNVIQPTPKTTLLAARDSMEIQSATKLREKGHTSRQSGSANVVINIGKKKTSNFEEVYEVYDEKSKTAKLSIDEDLEVPSDVGLASLHNDSLHVIPTHVPDHDHIINYEKVCPMEQCQRMHMDSFSRRLPPYLRASPYLHFEQTFEEYETCTPEQLEILKQRMESKQMKAEPKQEEPLSEWEPSVEGVGTQTSGIFDELPPCTCNGDSLEDSDDGMIFNVEDLVPIKLALESINKACFFERGIEFHRFKVIGEDSKDNIKSSKKADPKQEFPRTRYQEIGKILKLHPSLLDIFQANTRC